MNIDKYDKILLSNADLDILFEWRDNHKDYVRNFKPVLHDGIIIMKHDNGEHVQLFQNKGQYYLYTILFHGNAVHQVIWDTNTGNGVTSYSKLSYDKEDEIKFNQTVISLHASLMAYMEYYSDKKEYVSVDTIITSKTKRRGKTKSSNKQKKSVIKIHRKSYTINVDREAVIVDRNKYNRQVEKWTVRGHWRQLKSGNKVWVKSYVKGEGKEITPKDYKF